MAAKRKPKKHAMDLFLELRRRNKVLFTIVVASAIILVWKGLWNIFDIVLDEWVFQGHLFWSNIFAAAIGLAILIGAGLVLEKLA